MGLGFLETSGLVRCELVCWKSAIALFAKYEAVGALVVDVGRFVGQGNRHPTAVWAIQRQVLDGAPLKVCRRKS